MFNRDFHSLDSLLVFKFIFNSKAGCYLLNASDVQSIIWTVVVVQ